MKLRILLPLILLPALATQMSFAQSKTESKQTLEREYGIDLKKIYTGSEVIALIKLVEAEAEQAIDCAFDEGYKQGLLSGVPEAEYWKTRCSQLESKLSKERRRKWLFAFGGFSCGLITGYGFGFTIQLQN